MRKIDIKSRHVSLVLVIFLLFVYGISYWIIVRSRQAAIVGNPDDILAGNFQGTLDSEPSMILIERGKIYNASEIKVKINDTVYEVNPQELVILFSSGSNGFIICPDLAIQLHPVDEENIVAKQVEIKRAGDSVDLFQVRAARATNNQSISSGEVIVFEKPVFTGRMNVQSERRVLLNGVTIYLNGKELAQCKEICIVNEDNHAATFLAEVDDRLELMCINDSNISLEGRATKVSGLFYTSDSSLVYSDSNRQYEYPIFHQNVLFESKDMELDYLMNRTGEIIAKGYPEKLLIGKFNVLGGFLQSLFSNIDSLTVSIVAVFISLLLEKLLEKQSK